MFPAGKKVKRRLSVNHTSKTINHHHAQTLKFVPESYNTQDMCDKAVNNYSSTIQFDPECHKTQ